jgi:hypothetical protein
VPAAEHLTFVLDLICHLESSSRAAEVEGPATTTVRVALVVDWSARRVLRGATAPAVLAELSRVAVLGTTGATQDLSA